MMVSDWIVFVRGFMHIGMVPFVFLIAICTFAGWITYRICDSLDSTMLYCILFIVGAGFSIESWQVASRLEQMLSFTAAATVGARLYKRLT